MQNDTQPLPDHLIASSTVLLVAGRAYPIDTVARAERVGDALLAEAEHSFDGVDFDGGAA